MTNKGCTVTARSCRGSPGLARARAHVAPRLVGHLSRRRWAQYVLCACTQAPPPPPMVSSIVP